MPFSFFPLPTLYVLFLTILTNPLSEGLGLENYSKLGIRERVKDTGGWVDKPHKKKKRTITIQNHTGGCWRKVEKNHGRKWCG